MSWLMSNRISLLKQPFHFPSSQISVGKFYYLLNINALCFTSCITYLRQSIQEWTKWNLWKTVFKRFEVNGLFKQITCLQIFQKLSSINFTWLIFEYFVPFLIFPNILIQITTLCRWFDKSFLPLTYPFSGHFSSFLVLPS